MALTFQCRNCEAYLTKAWIDGAFTVHEIVEYACDFDNHKPACPECGYIHNYFRDDLIFALGELLEKALKKED